MDIFKIIDNDKSGMRELRIFNVRIASWLRSKNIVKAVQKQQKMLNAICTNIDFEAKGVLRNIQLIQLNALKVFDKFASENGILYWIDFVTLLGARRYGKFIPWDDDIDLSVVRSDYVRLNELSTNLPEDYILEKSEDGRTFIFRDKRFPGCLKIDIFPVDLINKCLSIEEGEKITTKIKRKYDESKLKQSIKKINDLLIGESIIYENNEHKAYGICYGVEFCHWKHSTIFRDKKDIFPLKRIKFEGGMYPCPNDVDKHLTLLYKDFEMPDFSIPCHSDVDKLALDEIVFINKEVVKYK